MRFLRPHILDVDQEMGIFLPALCILSSPAERIIVMDMLKMLTFTELFGGLSEESKRMLAEIAIPKSLIKGEYLFHEGQKGYALYILGQGSIQLLKSGPEDKEIVVRIIKPGEVFAEVILFEQDYYPVSAVALDTCAVFFLPKHQFHCLLDNKLFRNDFIVFLMHKQRYLTSRLMYVQSYNIEHRLCFFLRDHYGQTEKICPGMSKKAMAASISTTPETLSRTLAQLKKSGLLAWEGQQIRIQKEFWKLACDY